MTKSMKIDFVSDVSCPWCVIGLKALEEALTRLGDEVAADIRFQPFELNPQMPPEGQDLYEHLAQKYGSTKAESDRNREMIRARGEDVGFEFRLERLRRIYNTFDTHRLLHFAMLEGRQLELEHALFEAYFTNGDNPGAHEVLLRVAEGVGLDPERVRAMLGSDEFADEVREQERYYQSRGIHAVPAVIVNDRHLIQGGQPPEIFEQALREIAQTDQPVE
jgi:predicted DsbA family dithiol-disulfide isomerase